MTGADLEAHYRRYIQCLNERRLDQLGQFAHEALVYNGEPKSLDQYRDLIAEAVAAIPDLYFDIRLLVVQDDQVGCRLSFDCTPEAEFLGLQPNGKRVSFSEHVFYRFVDGKVAEVWSLIDRSGLAAQLAR